MNVLDLFSGIGGFSLGLERAGMKTAAFCEIDEACHQVLRKHWPTTPIFSDVTNLSSKDLNEHIDVICGGFPCQDISLVGKGAGLAGERSGLWFQFHRLISELRPSWVIAENVSALRSRGLDAVLRSLAEIGYDAEWHCIPASALGAPHRRDRVWIVAYPSSQPGLQTTSIFDTLGTGWDPREDAGRGPWRKEPSGDWALPQPVSLRMDDGVPYRMDRYKQLGNAVVPQIPELIGRAILQSIRCHSSGVEDFQKAA